MENQEEVKPGIYQHAVKFGLIMSGIMITLTVIFYAVSLSFMASFKFIGLTLAIALGFVIYAGINYRNSNGGYLTYGKAYVHGLVVLLAAGLVNTVFSILLYHVIDPGLPEVMGKTIIENTEDTMRDWGAPESTIEQTIAGMETQMETQFSIGNLMLGYLKGIIAYAIVALLTALFVKRSEPEAV